MKNFTQNVLFVLALTLAVVSGAYAQATTPSTTLSSALTSGSITVNVTSASGMSGASLGAFQTELFVDQELIGVQSISGNVLTVQRGILGTRQVAHANAATVWNGPPNYFSVNLEPTGACTSTNEVALPRFFISSGNGWTCPASGPRSGLWTLWYPTQAAVLPADSSLTGTAGLSVCHATYDFAVDGGAVGLITPKQNCTIPKNAIVYQGITEVGTALVGSTGNVSVGLSAGAGGAAALMAATARGSYTANLMFQAPPVQTTASASNTSYFKMTAAGQVTVTVATNALTAGVLDIYVWYVVPKS